jgi:hypothetical protein
MQYERRERPKGSGKEPQSHGAPSNSRRIAKYPRVDWRWRKGKDKALPCMSSVVRLIRRTPSFPPFLPPARPPARRGNACAGCGAGAGVRVLMLQQGRIGRVSFVALLQTMAAGFFITVPSPLSLSAALFLLSRVRRCALPSAAWLLLCSRALPQCRSGVVSAVLFHSGRPQVFCGGWSDGCRVQARTLTQRDWGRPSQRG